MSDRNKTSKEIASDILIAAINNGLLQGQKPHSEGLDVMMDKAGKAFCAIHKHVVNPEKHHETD